MTTRSLPIETVNICYPLRKCVAIRFIHLDITALGEPTDSVCHWTWQCICACSIIRLDCYWGLLISGVFVWNTCAIDMVGDDEILDGGNCVSENLASIDEIANLQDKVYV